MRQLKKTAGSDGFLTFRTLRENNLEFSTSVKTVPSYFPKRHKFGGSATSESSGAGDTSHDLN